MADVKKIATRESYGNALVELGKKYDNVVVLDADLAAATKTGVFKKAFPERHFDCGIAECNMVDVAAGLSTMGLVPFASSFAMFAAGRAFEQIRNTLGYPHNNVKIGATHGGISVGEDGASHQCCEDFALMRSIPGMVVINPSDDVEAKAAVEAAYHYQDAGIHARVINIHTIKPLDKELVIKAAKETGRIITAEEHNIIGGLGEAVCSAVCDECPVPVTRIGVNDEFGHSGPAVELLKQFGLSAEHIADVAKKVLKK